MKRVCIILLSLFCTIHLAAQETSLEKVVPKVLIDGYFFISRPESLPVKTSMVTCKPCIAEMPAISKWKERYPSIHFFSATYNTAEEALPIIQRRNFTYTHLVNVSDTIMDLVGKAGFPCTIIVDRNGTVVHIESGTSPKQLYDLEETLKQLHNQHK